MPITKELYAKTDEGKDVYIFSLKNSRMEIKILNYGGRITHIFAPDRDGQLEDITLGYDDFDGYKTDAVYFGAIMGRYVGRIAKGNFTLEGVTYNLTVNNPPNALHGGTEGFDKRLWDAKIEDNVLVLSYTSVDGEEHYPGEVKVTVTYKLTDENELLMSYRATTNKPTIINLTNHAYFNLAGQASGNLENHEIQMDADHYSPVDPDTAIPTGVIAPVSGTVFDLRSPTDLGQRLPQVPGGKGFDNNLVPGRTAWDKHVARVTHSPSGRTLDMYSTEPGVNLYTAYYIDGTLGKGGVTYKKLGAFCLEAQHYPDSPNKPSFPNTELRPGQTYTQQTKYVFGVF